MTPTGDDHTPEPPLTTDQEIAEDLESFGFNSTQWFDELAEALVEQHLGTIGGYELVSEVERGAQGVVYKAIETRAKRTVAVKMLRGGKASAKELTRSFERELQAIGRLSHPGIVTLLSSQIVDDRPLIVLEWIDGIYLKNWCDSPDRTDADVLRVHREIASAIAHAHRAAVLHRDLKPSNVRVDHDGRARVLDFGLAWFIDSIEKAESGSQPPRKGFVGTKRYAPPEAVEGDLAATDAGADVYALGVMLDEARPRLRSARQSQDLQAVIARATAEDPSERYPSAAEFERDLIAIEAGAETSIRRWNLSERTTATMRKRPTLVFGVAAMICVGALLVSRYLADNARTLEEARQRLAVQSFFEGLVAPGTGNPASTIAVSDALDLAANRLARTDGFSPENRAALFQRLADQAMAFGMMDRAGAFADQANEILKSMTDRRADRLVRIRNLMVRGTVAALRRDPIAVELQRQAISLVEDKDGRLYALAMGELGFAHASVGNNDEASRWLNDAILLLERLGELHPGRPIDGALVLIARADFDRLQRPAEAKRNYLRAAELVLAINGPDDFRWLYCVVSAARLSASTGERAAAREVLTSAAAAAKGVPQHESRILAELQALAND
ncbi:MAG: serine/threonine-protein kinase [Planctomycetota bacterium]